MLVFDDSLHVYLLSSVLALEDQGRITKELEEKRKQAEEAQLQLQQEREEAEKEHGRMMERVRYEQEEKDKIVGDIPCVQNELTSFQHMWYSTDSPDCWVWWGRKSSRTVHDPVEKIDLRSSYETHRKINF